MCIFISALHERKLRSKFSQPVSVFAPTSPDFQGRPAPKARSVSSSALGAVLGRTSGGNALCLACAMMHPAGEDLSMGELGVRVALWCRRW